MSSDMHPKNTPLIVLMSYLYNLNKFVWSELLYLHGEQVILINQFFFRIVVVQIFFFQSFHSSTYIHLDMKWKIIQKPQFRENRIYSNINGALTYFGMGFDSTEESLLDVDLTRCERWLIFRVDCESKAMSC